MPMLSTGGDQLVPVEGAFRQQEQLESPQEFESSVDASSSAWQHELEQQLAGAWTTGAGPQQDAPEAALTMQQHNGITAAVSRAMKRWAGCRLRVAMTTRFYLTFRVCRSERSFRSPCGMNLKGTLSSIFCLSAA